MELLDRYLQAVKKHLPWKGQDDIVAELQANLESQLEDREAGLGRPLTQEEVEAWLKELGPPIQVAARYKPQQYLIGPAVFPTYWFVLRTALYWAVTIYSIVSGIQILTGDIVAPPEMVGAVLRLPVVLMTVAAWVTLTFAALEFAIMRSLIPWPWNQGASAEWSPGTMPPVNMGTAFGKKRRSYAQAVAEVIFGILLLVWLLLFPRFPALLLGPGAIYLQVSQFQLAPVWWQFYWWTVALTAVQFAWRGVDLWRGSWQRPRTVQQIAFKAFGLIPMAIVLSAPDHVLVLLKHPMLDAARYGATLDLINYWANRGLLIVLAIAGLQLIWDLWRVGWEAYRKRSVPR